MSTHTPSSAVPGLDALRDLVPEEWHIVCSWDWQIMQDQALGSKAQGLLGLPYGWVPPWIVIVPAMPGQHDPPNLAAEIEAHLLSARMLVVRSNGPLEFATPAGASSRVIPASWESLIEAVAVSMKAQVHSWPLIQVAIEPSALGVLGNDRVLSPEKCHWVAEGPLADLCSAQIVINITSSTPIENNAPLEATEQELEPHLPG